MAHSTYPIWQLIDSSNIGGIERHIETLTRALLENGFPCEIVLYQDHGPNPWLDQLAAANLPVKILGGSSTALQKALRVEKPALLHTHGYKASILGKVCGKLVGVPTVTTYHSGERGAFPVSLYQQADEATAFLSRAIAVSEPIKERLPDSTELVHNFIDLPDLKMGEQADELNIGFVGRFSHEKAPDLFVEIAKRIAAEPTFDNVKFHMIGDGPMREEVEADAPSNVVFHGLVTDMSKVWPELDALLIPSRAEGLPLAALEAMSYGLPVFASRVGALPSLIDEKINGNLFQAGDMKDAERALTQWLACTKEEQQKMRRAARATIEAQFSPKVGLERIMAIYEEAGYRSTPLVESYTSAQAQSVA